MDKIISTIIQFLARLLTDKQVRELTSQITLPRIEQVTGLDIPDQITVAVGDRSLADMVSTPEKIADDLPQSLPKTDDICGKIAEELVPNLPAVDQISEIIPENLSQVTDLGGLS